MTRLARRLLLFFVGFPALISIIVFLPYYRHLAFNIAVILVSALGASELASMFAKSGHAVRQRLSPVLGASLPIVAYLEVTGLVGSHAFLVVLVATVTLVLVLELFLAEPEAFSAILPRTAATLAVLVYPGLFFSFTVRLSGLPHASAILVAFFVMVFGNDALAYAVGSLWGRNGRTVLQISPNKSIAGFAGGLFASFLVAVVSYLIVPRMYANQLLFALGLGACAGITTIAGDLVESALKRSASVKDSGNIIPGRGGILDSTDSLLLSAPLFFFFFHLILV
jgi:phosphatidate cytidylyltransferase